MSDLTGKDLFRKGTTRRDSWGKPHHLLLITTSDFGAPKGKEEHLRLKVARESICWKVIFYVAKFGRILLGKGKEKRILLQPVQFLEVNHDTPDNIRESLVWLFVVRYSQSFTRWGHAFLHIPFRSPIRRCAEQLRLLIHLSTMSGPNPRRKALMDTSAEALNPPPTHPHTHTPAACTPQLSCLILNVKHIQLKYNIQVGCLSRRTIFAAHQTIILLL